MEWLAYTGLFREGSRFSISYGGMEWSAYTGLFRDGSGFSISYLQEIRIGYGLECIDLLRDGKGNVVINI